MATKMNSENPFLLDLKKIVYNLDNFKFTPERLKYLERVKHIPEYSNYSKENWRTFLSYSTEDSPVNNIKNWLRYRILGELGVDIDCDCTKEVFDLYNHIFNENNIFGDKESDAMKKTNKLRTFKVGELFLETDTMNSFATIFNKFMRTRLPDDWAKSYCRLFHIKDGSKLYRDLYFLVTIDEWYNKWENEHKEILNEFNIFASHTGCLANMILVPLNYNTGRYPATKDFWDLTLIDLQCKYTQRQHYDEGFTFISENMEKLMLTDWFNDMSGDSFDKYTVKPLFKEHSFKKMMPENDEEFLECLKGINQMIEKRADRLFEKFPHYNYQMQEPFSEYAGNNFNKPKGDE